SNNVYNAIDTICDQNLAGKLMVGSAGNSNIINAYKKEYMFGDTSSIHIWYDSLGIDSMIRIITDSTDHVGISFEIFSFNNYEKLDSNISISLISPFDTIVSFQSNMTTSILEDIIFDRDSIIKDGYYITERLRYNIYKDISYSYIRSGIIDGTKKNKAWGFKLKRMSSDYQSSVIIKFSLYLPWSSSIPEFPISNLEFNTLSYLGNEKNFITVGSSIHRYWGGMDPSLVNTLGAFSGHGPSIILGEYSGIKPDIVSPGHGMIGILRNADLPDSVHGYGTGTSCAAPIVTG
ncbi:unnamed protein product, partial [marine sediment metagenome]